jgi:hypothetical protein
MRGVIMAPRVSRFETRHFQQEPTEPKRCGPGAPSKLHAVRHLTARCEALPSSYKQSAYRARRSWYAGKTPPDGPHFLHDPP